MISPGSCSRGLRSLPSAGVPGNKRAKGLEVNREKDRNPTAIAPMAKPLMVRGGRLLCWLSEDMESPSQLKGGLKRLGGVDYHLPAPAERQRHLVHYGK